MQFKTALIVAALGLFALPAWSQTGQLNASAVITANLQGQTSASGVTDTATYSGGIVFSVRYHFRAHLDFGANGGFTTFTQYYRPVQAQEQANIYEGTAVAIYNFRDAAVKLRPFVEGGGGVLYFSPVASGSTPGGAKVVQPAVVAGVGVDYKLGARFSARLGYRGLFYKPASFNVASQTVNTITQMGEPYIGLVLKF
jgi:hypothetical protein